MNFRPFLFILIISSYSVFGQVNIKGTVVDSLNGEYISYVNVWEEGSQNGVLTNTLGTFYLNIDTTKTGTISFNYLGYKSKSFSIKELIKRKPLVIKLSPSFFNLNTVVISPISAQEYIRRAIVNIPNNYCTDTTLNQYYYREIIKENDVYNRFTEAVFDVYQPPLKSKLEDSSSIILKGVRSLNNKQYINFMRDYVGKKIEKENKKKIKKGEDIVEFTDISQYVYFRNPYKVFDNTFALTKLSFLDSNHFNKYKYNLEYAYKENGKSMLCIRFNQIKKIESFFFSGLIYLSDSSYVIKGIEFELNKKGKNKLIPSWAKAALWVLRLSIDNPNISSKIIFNEVNNVWNLNYFFIKFEGKLTKKYFFDNNEVGVFNLNQSLIFIKPIDIINTTGNILKRTEKIHEKILENDNNLNWEKFRMLAP